MKKALITGITGQDGSYLTELLLSKDYIVHGLVRPSSSFNRGRIDHLYLDRSLMDKYLFLYYADLADSSCISRLMEQIEPDEIYNLGAQSHVQRSFEIPEYTAETNALGTLRLLDAIKECSKKTRFYQASTSELYGNSEQSPQSEKTNFSPCSPYAASKLFSYWVTKNYSDAYGIFGCNGILFNHESPRRGETFVTKKISRSVAMIKQGMLDKFSLGNLSSKRDWGYAKDYVEAMWLMLQEETPNDYVIATGESHSVREFCEVAFQVIDVQLEWVGSGVTEKGIDTNTGKCLVDVDPQYFRPTDVECLLGDPTKANECLNWKHTVNFKQLVKIMVDHDLNNI